MIMKCMPKDRDEQRQFMYHLLPLNHIEWADSNGKMNQRINLMSDDTEYHLINYNATDFCTKRLEDYGNKSLLARINLAVHPYVYPRAMIGEEIKEEILETIYLTEQDKMENYRKTTNTNINGLEECLQDSGRLQINQNNFLVRENLVEVHLHPTEDGGIAVSPNNGCFLINMSQPIITFVVLMKQFKSQHTSNATSVFVINIAT
jgi:hypothetical protein